MNGNKISKPQMNTKVFPHILKFLWLVFLLSLAISACSGKQPEPVLPVMAKELVLYNWVEYMPQAVLDAFEKEFGVKVIYQTYDTMEEAVDNISSGDTPYDVAVIENDYLVALTDNNLLAGINIQSIPNIKNISPNFRDLAVDPGNKHSIPYNYGTTGLLVRTDLVTAPIEHWVDLWDEQYAGKIAVRGQPTELISVALKSLGYPLNSEDPIQLQEAHKRLLTLKKSVVFVDVGPEKALQPLLDGEVVVLLGWDGDARLAQERNSEIQYVLPEEGTMVWGDSFVISAKTQNKYTAELFLNFLLRPEISAEIVKSYFFPTTNDAARNYLPADIVNDHLVFPQGQSFSMNDFYLPLSIEGQKSYAEIWNQVLGDQ